jgi:signal transduction histidine kinase
MSQNYKLGDIRGGISIRLNMAEYIEAQRKVAMNSGVSSVLIWFAGVALIIYGAGKLGKYAEARDKAEQELWEMKENLESLVAQRTDDLRKTQKSLVRQEKLASLGSLSAGVAHEIRNPLNIIATTAQLMVMDAAASGEIKEACGEIMGQVKRITRITDSLHGFAREMKPDMAPLDLRSILDNAISSTEGGMDIENMRIIREYGPAPLMINGDADQIARVFLHFILNARDSVMEKRQTLAGREWAGELVISGVISEGWVVVSFTDNGVGVPPEIQDKIFDPFFTTKEVNKGAGLGLAAAYGMIENHGGTMGVFSEGGNGATFTVRLPSGVV